MTSDICKDCPARGDYLLCCDRRCVMLESWIVKEIDAARKKALAELVGIKTREKFKKMKTATATLYISVILACPECDEIVDLTEIDHLTDDCWIYSKVTSGNFGSEDFNEKITCPHCGEAFLVDKVNW